MQSIIKDKSFVDVILPNYNKAEFLEESINSVVSQTYKNWRMYIIDDNSTDKSRDIINKFSNLKNVSVINLKKKYGPIFLQKLCNENITIKIYSIHRM